MTDTPMNMDPALDAEVINIDTPSPPHNNANTPHQIIRNQFGPGHLQIILSTESTWPNGRLVRVAGYHYNDVPMVLDEMSMLFTTGIYTDSDLQGMVDRFSNANLSGMLRDPDQREAVQKALVFENPDFKLLKIVGHAPRIYPRAILGQEYYTNQIETMSLALLYNRDQIVINLHQMNGLKEIVLGQAFIAIHPAPQDNEPQNRITARSIVRGLDRGDNVVAGQVLTTINQAYPLRLHQASKPGVLLVGQCMIFFSVPQDGLVYDMGVRVVFGYVTGDSTRALRIIEYELTPKKPADADDDDEETADEILVRTQHEFPSLHGKYATRLNSTTQAWDIHLANDPTATALAYRTTTAFPTVCTGPPAPRIPKFFFLSDRIASILYRIVF